MFELRSGDRCNHRGDCSAAALAPGKRRNGFQRGKNTRQRESKRGLLVQPEEQAERERDLESPLYPTFSDGCDTHPTREGGVLEVMAVFRAGSFDEPGARHVYSLFPGTVLVWPQHFVWCETSGGLLVPVR